MGDLTFIPAKREQGKARIALVGPSGSGKTWTALSIASGLAPTGRIAVIDTEHGSASKYAGLWEFDVLCLDTFAPERYIAAIKAAEAAGYDVVVIDSLSHEWVGPGGALEMVDAETIRSKSTNSYTAWRKVTPEHNRLFDTIIRCNSHVVATLRTKTEYVIEKDDRGKAVPRKIGLAPITREGADYEFDVVAEMDLDHLLIVTKTRCPDLDGLAVRKPDKSFGEQVRAWLSDAPPRAPVEAFTPSIVSPEQSKAPTGQAAITGNVAAEVVGAVKRGVKGAIEDAGEDTDQLLAVLRKIAAMGDTDNRAAALKLWEEHVIAVGGPDTMYQAIEELEGWLQTTERDGLIASLQKSKDLLVYRARAVP